MQTTRTLVAIVLYGASACIGADASEMGRNFEENTESEYAHVEITGTDEVSNIDNSIVAKDRKSATNIGVPSSNLIRPVMFQPDVVPQPIIRSPTTSSESPTESRSRGFRIAFGRTLNDRVQISEERQRLVFGPSVNIVGRGEAKVLPLSYTGSLLKKSKATSGVRSVKRSPIVTDTRIRGRRVGQTLAAGSFWVPARMDLDTMLSKIDADIIEDVIVIKGPYSVLYGPGFDFVDIQLMRSPRLDDGHPVYGSTSIDYQSNHQSWYGRQSFWGGSSDWGFHISYGHRTGNDYHSGYGLVIPADFKARDLFVAVGRDIGDGQTLEFNFLRLDETDVEFPGQAFDMDFLVTDGIEFQYEAGHVGDFDRMTLDAWYNRTRFAGTAQRNDKREQFPIFEEIDIQGNTDVDSLSTGFRHTMMWQPSEAEQITVGVDFRFIKQELNEITSADRSRTEFWNNANSPIPRSHSSNPGLFAEYSWEYSERLRLRTGGRVDWVSSNLEASEAELAELGTLRNQPSFAEIVGSNEYDQDHQLCAFYLSSEYEIDEQWSLKSSGGHAQRAPTLTELYSAEPFMFLLQNGLNTVTGDPRLNIERAWQIDVALQYRHHDLALSVNGFHAWILDYITFENMAIQPMSPPPPATQQDPQQVQLKFVNTDLAILRGVEFATTYDPTDCFTLFSSLSYINGSDRSRNGNFATRPVAGANMPSARIPGRPRGFFSGTRAGDHEPLPSILPFDSRLGGRIHQTGPEPAWSVELSVRIVDGQDRVASSLLESSTPGFAVWDLRSFWKVNDRLLLIAGVENLGDRNYAEHLDYRPIDANSSRAVFQPGIDFYFGGELTY